MLLPRVLLLLLAHLTSTYAHPSTHHRRGSKAPARNVPPEGFYNPTADGGSWLTFVPNTYPEGMGEPVNMVLSGASDEAVLQDSEQNGGFRNYMLSLGQDLGGLAGECLGQHSGSDQSLNLGDGNGPLNETAVLRWDYGDPQLGTCKESIQGGDHIRYWVQNGEKANSGAIFMAASYEKPIAEGHDIILDGYNVGRDLLIGNVTAQNTPINTSALTNGSMFSGSSSYAGYTYQTTVIYTAGYADNSSIGINHNGSVAIDGRPAVDGLIAVMTVRISAQPQGASKNSAGPALSPSSLSLLAFLGFIALAL